MRTKPEVLVITRKVLVFQINVEELARIPRLRHIVHKVQPGHLLMRHFRVHAYHFWIFQCFNKGQHVAGGS